MTWLQTTSGRAFDLLHPDWREVDFTVDIPEALARIARFTGHVSSGPYSVAQHCVIGADAVFRETGDRKAAAAFLLHDAHEAYLGDIATPIAKALCAPAQDYTPGGGNAVAFAIKSLKLRIDEAIADAAGLGWDVLSAHEKLVKAFDKRMLDLERRHLMAKPPREWAASDLAPIRIAGKLTVWPWPKAADEYRERLRRYLPERFGAGPSPSPRPSRTGARRILTEA